MKRFTLLLFFFLFAIVADAQYKIMQQLCCTGKNVNVRTGPGINYPIASDCLYGDEKELEFMPPEFGGYPHILGPARNRKDRLRINKPSHNCFNPSIFYLGKEQNGFLRVLFGFEDDFWIVGWVSAQYLVPACLECNGQGWDFQDQKCPKCLGRGY